MNILLKRSVFLIFIFIGFYLFQSEIEKLNNKSLYKKNFKFTDQLQIFEDNKINENKKITNIEIEKLNQKINEDYTQKKLLRSEIKIKKGDTFLSILKSFNYKQKEIFEIISKIEEYYDLRKLKIGESIIIYKNKIDDIKIIEIFKDIDTLISVSLNQDIEVELKRLKKITFQESKEFKIENSLYSDGLVNNIPQDILIKLIKLFSFDLDFQRDIKKNTLVSISYDFNQIEEINKIEYKDINYALIKIDGKDLEYFKFFTDEGYIDYFNREGKNVKKSILKTPIDGARLSSNFGMRKHPISGFNKMHKGVDFAAPKGTPIYAGGNGVIEFAGTNGGYGKYIRIRHNNEYKTAYAHLSSFKKGISKGSRVIQGEVIGYVGSTGVSTGPHLHYEILFQNKQINPLKLKLPSGKKLKDDELKRFKEEYMKIYAQHLNLLYE